MQIDIIEIMINLRGVMKIYNPTYVILLYR